MIAVYFQDKISELESELSQSITALDALSPTDQSYESINSSINNTRAHIQTLRDSTVTLEIQRNTIVNSITECKEELREYDGTPRKSTNIQMARAQSEQSNTSTTTPTTTSKKSKKR